MKRLKAKFKLDQEVTVHYPRSGHYRGEVKDGTIQRVIRTPSDIKYTVLWDGEDTASVLVPEEWITARGQLPLEET